MKKVRLIISSVVMMIGLVALPIVPQYAGAQATTPQSPTQNPTDPKGQATGGVNAVGGTGQNGFTTLLGNIINIMLFLIGAIAVIMIVVGGIRYTTSGGDSSSITGAKNTILYAIVGLVVAIMAYAIVNFVLQAL